MLAAAAWCLAAGAALAQPPAPREPPAAPDYRPWGFDLSGRDTAIAPGNDFFGYSDGTAVRTMVIPPDRTSWGAFNRLAELSRTRVQDILAGLAAHPVANPVSVEDKLGAFYAAFMDDKAVEARGLQPLQADLAAIRAVSDRAGFAALQGDAQRGLQFSLFGLGVQPDARDPTRFSVALSQGGTGLPDRDYYLEPRFADKKAAYRNYAAALLGLVGWPDADAQATALVAFETRLAQAHWARADERDPDRTYNPMTVDALARAAPGFDWRGFLAHAELGDVRALVLAENTAVLAQARIAGETGLPTLRAWLAFHLADDAADLLPAPFVEASFGFHGRTLSGQPRLEPRWKRAVAATSGAMDMAIGKVYAERFFPADDKTAMVALTGELKAVFRTRLQHNAWMSPATRAAAVAKLDNQLILIGYPDSWRDYSGLVVRPDDPYGNTVRAAAFDWRYHVGHLGHPVDRREWDMSPQTVNAYNAPGFDEVVFPAAILQPPFFNRNADPAINYGAIGGVIGHEMTHSFDDQGRKFDLHGRLHDWWTPADAARFQSRADRLAAQFDALEPFPGMHVNGRLTLGENIADLGGLTLALDAYHASLQGHDAPVIDGLTGDQRVFLGWAQVWRQTVRPDRARMLLVTDPHSPPMARVNMPMHNIDAWYKAWTVKPGDALFLAPQDRVRIW